MKVFQRIKEGLAGCAVGNRGQMGLGGLPPAVIAIVVAALVMGLGALVLNSFATNANNTNVTLITNNAQSGFNTIAGQFGTIGTVLVAAILLGLVAGFAYFLGGGVGGKGRR